MKSIDIKGKQYVMVHERIRHFRENYKGWQLTSEIIDLTDERVVIKASITSDLGLVMATGHAYEDKDSTFINKTSFIENAETSAWGRCLASFGIGIDESIASFEEVANAITQQKDNPWLDHKGFNNAVRALNEMGVKEHREEYVKDLYSRFKVKKDYRAQFSEIIEQRDINV